MEYYTLKKIRLLAVFALFVPTFAFTESLFPNGGGAFTPDDILALINRATDIVLLAGGIVAVAMIMWGGVTMGTSGGSEERVIKGRKIITAAIVGLLIAIFAKVIIVTLMKVLGG